MSMKCLARVCLAGAVLYGAVSRAAAHPPDLPVDTKEVCVPYSDEECSELNTCKPCEPPYVTSPMLCEIISRFCQSFTVGFGGVPVIDLDLEFFCGQSEAVTAGGAEIIRASASVAMPAQLDDSRRAHARKLYLIGERCRRAGDFEMAENCYEEAKLLCPGCDYAGKAERRIRQVRALRASEPEDIGEESEPAKKETPQTLPDGDSSSEVSLPPWATWPLESSSERWRQIERLAGKRLVFETDVARLSEAKAMYYVGERCRRGGDPDMAYRCYEDASRICPQCRHGMKAQLRMRQIKEKSEVEKTLSRTVQATVDIIGTAVPPGGCLGFTVPVGSYTYRSRLRYELQELESEVPLIAASFMLVDSDVIRTFEKLTDETALPPAGIEIVVEELQPMLEGDEEESDYPLSQCSGTVAPPTFFIAPAPRQLRLGEDQEEAAQTPETPACDDLSDWLPQAVRLMRGSGSLRIDTARLGRLLARGEAAVRALGCSVVSQGGRSFVVYPAR